MPEFGYHCATRFINFQEVNEVSLTQTAMHAENTAAFTIISTTTTTTVRSTEYYCVHPLFKVGIKFY